MTPEDFFNEIFDHPEDYKEHYDGLSADKQQEFLAIFDRMDVWKAGLGGMWLSGIDNEEELRAAKQRVEAFIEANWK